MQRNYQVNDFTNFNQQELRQRIAYHEAGHATAIYLYNKLHALPPIFFQINLKPDNGLDRDALSFTPEGIAAKVEGGYLVRDLHLSFERLQDSMSETEILEYQKALDADMINLLAGAIAEAHYLSVRDGELLNANLLSIDALRRYGGDSDLIRIDDYLRYLPENKVSKQQKLAALLLQSFEFMMQPKIWKAVNAVAKFILESKKQIICCEEVFEVIDRVTV